MFPRHIKQMCGPEFPGDPRHPPPGALRGSPTLPSDPQRSPSDSLRDARGTHCGSTVSGRNSRGKGASRDGDAVGSRMCEVCGKEGGRSTSLTYP